MALRRHFFADHPKELVDVVTGIARQATEDDQHVVDIERAHDGISVCLQVARSMNPGWRGRVRTSLEAIAVPTVAMCELFHVLLSTMTVRFAIAVIW